MKSTSLFIAALIVVGAVVTAVGKEEPTKAGLAVVPVKGSEVFKVIYKGETAGRVKLNLYDAKGTIIFSESINAGEGFIRPLNFTGLQAGEYTVELVDASGKKVEKINYVTKKLASVVRVSRLANEDGKYLLAIANPAGEQISVKIYNENNLIHTESKVINGDFAQVYALKNVTGSVTFEVSDLAGNTKVIRY
ncbi:MAG: hypothetical protein JNM57_14000 [Cyclobacteriaceae bacterium]|nr:hypothetical protein [Cyclobacteriaceae bacterium]